MTAVSRRQFTLGLAAASLVKGIAAREFELGHVELRSMWKKSVTRLDEKELGEVEAILRKNALGVSSIAGPLFKLAQAGLP